MEVQAFGKQFQSSGYVALLSVLIVGAISTVIGVSLLLLGTNASRTSFALQQSNQSKALANACAETALQMIRNDTTYTTADTSFALGQGTCHYTVVNNPSGENKKITAYGTVGTMTRKVQITTTAINPKIIISSWQEVADFN
jgi:hypothetical protein